MQVRWLLRVSKKLLGRKGFWKRLPFLKIFKFFKGSNTNPSGNAGQGTAGKNKYNLLV